MNKIKPNLPAKRHGSTILSILSVIGVVATAVTVAKATPKAVHLLEEVKEDSDDRELSIVEKAKIIAPVYIPSVIIGISTVACILGISALSRKQQTSLVSAYALLDQSYRKYRQKVVEIYGKEADEEIVDSIAIEEAKAVYPVAVNICSVYSQALEESYSKPILFYEEYGHRYFEAPLEQVLQAEYHVNRNYILGGCVLLNDLYEFLGLEPTEYGQSVGWAVDDDEIYWIDFNHRKITLDDGLECYLIETMIPPNTDWQELYN